MECIAIIGVICWISICKHHKSNESKEKNKTEYEQNSCDWGEHNFKDLHPHFSEGTYEKKKDKYIDEFNWHWFFAVGIFVDCHYYDVNWTYQHCQHHQSTAKNGSFGKFFNEDSHENKTKKDHIRK